MRLPLDNCSKLTIRQPNGSWKKSKSFLMKLGPVLCINVTFIWWRITVKLPEIGLGYITLESILSISVLEWQIRRVGCWILQKKVWGMQESRNLLHKELHFICGILYKRSMGGRINIMNYYLPQRHITIIYDISATKALICLKGFNTLLNQS